jgi:uncharacterized protein
MQTGFKYFIYLLFIFLTSCDSSSRDFFHSEEVEFINNIDGAILSGTLTLPKNKSNIPAVILIHGSGPMDRDMGFEGHTPYKDLAEYLSNKGIAVLRYDKRGVGKSSGQFIPYDLDNFRNDGIAGVEYLKTIKEIDKSSIGAIGISEGGLVVQKMAFSCSDIRFIVLLGSPGIWGKEFFYAYQLAVTKAAGFNQNDINEMTTAFNKLWPLLTKENINSDEEAEGKSLLLKIWSYTDMESRNDLGLIDKNLDFYFQLYRGEKLRKSYNYIPKEIISQLKCSVLALNGDKDIQTVSHVNLPAIKEALEKGMCKDYKIVELKNHNHIFQICNTGKYSEYKIIKGTFSTESLSIIEEWIKRIKIKKTAQNTVY